MRRWVGPPPDQDVFDVRSTGQPGRPHESSSRGRSGLGGGRWSGASWWPARPSMFRRPRQGEAPPPGSRRRSRPPSPSRSPGRWVWTSSSASRTTWCRGGPARARGGLPGATSRWRPGSRLRVAFWRDDVGIAAEGGRLRTTVRLYFTLGLAFGGVSNVIECGTPAAPGVVTLPLVTTFAWHPESRLVPTTVAGAPEVTSACPDALSGRGPPRVSHGHASSGPHDAGVSDRRARRATDRLPGRGRALLGAARRAHPPRGGGRAAAESASRVGGARGVHPRRGRRPRCPSWPTRRSCWGPPRPRPRSPRPRPCRRSPRARRRIAS